MSELSAKLASLPRWAAGLLIGALSANCIWAYWPTLRGMSAQWSEDPQYSHAYLVPAFALYLLWRGRGAFAKAGITPSRWGLLFLIGGASMRFAGAVFFVEWFETISILPTLVGAVLFLAGWKATRIALPAIGFLLFMVPLPYRLATGLALPLQRLATACCTYVLQTLGLPAFAEGNIISLGSSRVGVEEACSGLGMLMLFSAMTLAAALLCKRPPWQKIVIFTSAVPVAIAANVIRITLTAVLLDAGGKNLAHLVYHDLSGWLMMPMALGFLFLLFQVLDRSIKDVPVKAHAASGLLSHLESQSRNHRSRRGRKGVNAPSACVVANAESGAETVPT